MSGQWIPGTDRAGASVQQHVVASVPSTLTAYGDYAVHVGLTHLMSGAQTDEIRHEVPEVVLVLAGALKMRLDDDVSEVCAGDHFVIPAGAWHRFVNATGTDASMVFAFGGDPIPVTERREPAPDHRGRARSRRTSSR
jgi:quercetin dioxygenase-like cupin family protein